jgi:hypothetical protein
VLTNNHVIEDSTKITATVAATGKTYPATVIGYDKTADIALIRLPGATGLRTVPVGNSAAVKDGEQVVALGNAEGQPGPAAARRPAADRHRVRDPDRHRAVSRPANRRRARQLRQPSRRLSPRSRPAPWSTGPSAAARPLRLG